MSQISDKADGRGAGPMPAESEMGNGPERRRAGRYPFTAAAEIIDLSSHAAWPGAVPTWDLAMLHRHSFAVCLGSPCSFVWSAKKGFRGDGQSHVRQVFDGNEAGVYRGQAGISGCLQAWVAELSGEALPKFDVAAPGPESGNLSTVLRLQQVLNELVSLMVRKKLINETEGAALLRKFISVMRQLLVCSFLI